ncbi:MAG TPA: hypothetical protein VNM90_03430 [Haliangium sp.]|nr:hypothetical protein [Haliangium sp.]
MNRPEPGQQALRFVASPWRHMVVLGDHPLVILERGLPWDDHGYKTLFQIHYYEPGKYDEPRRLGAVKILLRDHKVTHLPPGEMDGLDESFCSLGQDLDYYENLQDLGQEIAHAILHGLRDMVVDPAIREAFHAGEGAEKSLLRSSAARIALRDAGRLLKGEGLVPTEPFRFQSNPGWRLDSGAPTFWRSLRAPRAAAASGWSACWDADAARAHRREPGSRSESSVATSTSTSTRSRKGSRSWWRASTFRMGSWPVYDSRWIRREEQTRRLLSVMHGIARP